MGASLPPWKTQREGDGSHHEEIHHRPTVVPAFDPADFARDSERKQRAASVVRESAIDEARRLHTSGDHEGALFLVTQLLEATPVHAEATQLAASCRVALEREYLAALGSGAAILIAAISTEELKNFALDSTSGFLFSLIDGALRVDDILDVAGLPRLLALRHLCKLLERGIVTVFWQPRQRLPQRSDIASIQDESRAEDDDCRIESGILPVQMHGPSLQAIPLLLVAASELSAMNVDPEARELLAFVDDKTSVEEILARASVDFVDGMVLFEQLTEDGVIAFA
jgi:hypothetical protein